MSTPHSTTPWTTAGMFALPLYALLLAVGTWSPQPDQVTDPDGWARFVASTPYLISHIATSVVGPVLVILGTFALTAVITQRAPRLAPTGLVLSTVGQVLLTVPGVISTFATPAVAQAYLRGNRDAMTLEFSDVMTVITMIAVLLTVAGNVVLGVAIARSRAFPRWTGIVWAAAAVVFYLLGAALGMATTGASLPTQPAGAALLAISGGAMAWTGVHRHHTQPTAEPTVPAAATSSRS
jgi:hypothetical protein